MSVVNVLDYGAKGDGATLDTAAIQAAIDQVHEHGGGTVIVPGGYTFLCSGIRLKSYVNLHLEPGSLLQTSTQQADYAGREAGEAHSRFSCLIEADGAEQISITGFGRIDGCGAAFIEKDLGGYIYSVKRWRPGLIFFLDCRQVTLRDVTLSESPWWTVHLVGCEDVLIHGIHIYNDLKMPNCDGIDPDHCRNVRISDCQIQCADDCIVLKNTAKFADRGSCRDITVTGCTLMCTATAVKIGTESVSDFENITVTACTIKSSSRGLGIQLRDQGSVRNVIFTNCTIETRLFEEHYWGKAEPIHISALHRFSYGNAQPPAWNPTNALGSVKHIMYSDILCRSENGIVIIGEPEIAIESIRFRNVMLNIDKWTKWRGGELDRRPVDGPAHAVRDGKSDPGVVAHTFSGAYIEHARDVELNGVRVTWGQNLPDYYAHALEARHAPGLKLENFQGEAPHPERGDAIVIEEGDFCQS